MGNVEGGLRVYAVVEFAADSVPQKVGLFLAVGFIGFRVGSHLGDDETAVGVSTEDGKSIRRLEKVSPALPRKREIMQ